MNTKEVAEQLNITVQTLRIWLKIFDITVSVDENRNRVYDKKIIVLLEKINELKQAGKGTNEIKKLLNITREFTMEITQETSNSTMEITNNNIREIIRTEIQQQTDLSREYAKASYMIGQLESENKSLKEKIQLLLAPDEFAKITTQNEMLKEEKERLLVTINEFDKVKEENITIKQKLSLFPEPEVFNQIKQKSEHLENENLILQRQVQKLLDEVDYHKLSWWDKLCLKLNKNQKMVVHKVNIEAMT